MNLRVLTLCSLLAATVHCGAEDLTSEQSYDELRSRVSLGIQPTSAQVGQSFTVTGSGFQSGLSVAISVDPSCCGGQTLNVGRSGTFSATFTSANAGTFSFTAVQSSRSWGGNRLSASARITVTAAASGSGGGGGSTDPNLWTEIAADMTGNNEGLPHGVPLSYDWANGPVVSLGNDPQGQTALESWGVVYEAAEGNPATNTRVNIRNMVAFWKRKSTGQWTLAQSTSTPDGAHYFEDFSGDANIPADIRQEADGSISVTAGGGYNFHFYPSDRASIDPNDMGGIVTVFQARLIVDDPSKPDDRAIARFLAGSGADYYPSLTGGWLGTATYDPAVALGKEKYVQTGWRFFSMTTLTAAQLSQDPPPLNLDGISP